MYAYRFRLCGGRAGNHRIRLDETVKIRVVVAGVVKVQADRAVVALPGELVARRRGPGGVARFTPRMIPQFRNFATGAAGGERRGSQVVAGQEGQRPRIAFAHRHALTAEVVVLDHRARAGVWQTAPNVVHSK